MIISKTITTTDIEEKEKTLLDEWYILAFYGDKTLFVCLKGCLYKVKQGGEENHTYSREEAVKWFNSL